MNTYVGGYLDGYRVVPVSRASGTVFWIVRKIMDETIISKHRTYKAAVAAAQKLAGIK
jgi:hypothetical protein